MPTHTTRDGVSLYYKDWGPRSVSDGVDAPRRHRCAKVAVLRNRYEGGVHPIAYRGQGGRSSSLMAGRCRPMRGTGKLRLTMAAMGQPETKVADLYRELGITRQTLYRHVSPQGTLRPDGDKLLARGRSHPQRIG